MRYYVYTSDFNTSTYPAADIYGNITCIRTTDKNVTQFIFKQNKLESNAYHIKIFVTAYNAATSYSPQWQELAKQSDLTNLSNSVVKTLDNVAPVNNNINMWNWFHRYPCTDFTNGLTTLEWINKGIFSCYFPESYTFPQKPSDWGQLINIPASAPNSGASEAFQLFVAQASGDIYYRGTNQTTQLDEVPFKRLTYVGESWAISKGTNGWARESSTGFTIQWGLSSARTSATVTFPRSFTALYSVTCTGRNGCIILYPIAPTNTSFKWHDVEIAESTGVYWIAVGIS